MIIRKTAFAIFALFLFTAFPAFGQTIGFEQEEIIVESDSGSVNIDVGVDSTLTGAQFDLDVSGTTDDPIVTKEYDEGTLQTNKVDPNTLRVLVFSGVGADSIQADNVVSVEVGNITTENQEITIIEGVGTIEENDETVEVDLTPDPATVIFKEGVVDLSIVESNVNFGEVIAGNAGTEQITVENNGNSTADVTSSADGSLFGAQQNPTIDPNSQATIDVTFSPTRTEFSERSGTAQVASEEDTASVSLEGTGVGGRGDPTLNGFLNITDITLTADFIVETETPSTNEQTAADVFPVPEEGDGTLNVSDLQATASAIVKEEWPDGEPAPSNFGGSSLSSLSVRGSAQIEFRENENGTMGVFATDIQNLRGIQIDVKTEADDAVGFNPEEVGDRMKLSYGSPSERKLKVLIFRQNGGPIAKDSLKLGTVPFSSIFIEETNALGVVGNNQTSSLSTEIVEIVDQNSLTVYPVPAKRSLTIDLEIKTSQNVRISIYDMLGRKVETVENREILSGNSKIEYDVSNLSSGAYFVKVSGERFNKGRRISVLR